MSYSMPPSREEVEELFEHALPFELICWECRRKPGMRLYAVQFPVSGYWAIRIACERCAKTLKRQNVKFYN